MTVLHASAESYLNVPRPVTRVGDLLRWSVPLPDDASAAADTLVGLHIGGQAAATAAAKRDESDSRSG